MTIPRGIANNNPGDIDYDGTPWLGLASPPSDGRFCRMISRGFGLRLLAKNLLADFHQDRNTPTLLAESWAPPNENNTAAYIAGLCRTTGWLANQRFDFTRQAQLESFMLAVTIEEYGHQPDGTDWYTSGEYAEAAAVALGAPIPPSWHQDATTPASNSPQSSQSDLLNDNPALTGVGAP